MSTPLKTRHCDECKHGRFVDVPGMLKPRMECLMLHKPRFYAPDYFDRDTWGYKRKCADFIAKEKSQGITALSTQGGQHE